MVDNAKVQEGTPPAEDSNALLERVEGMATELKVLITAINKTNLSATLPNGQSLTEAIAERDVLRLRIGYYTRLADAAVVKQAVVTRSEVRFHARTVLMV